jgi:hypothetical protein
MKRIPPPPPPPPGNPPAPPATVRVPTTETQRQHSTRQKRQVRTEEEDEVEKKKRRSNERTVIFEGDQVGGLNVDGSSAASAAADLVRAADTLTTARLTDRHTVTEKSSTSE